MDYTTPPTWAAFAGLALLAIISYVGAVRRRRSGRRYPPAVGTVFHKLYHFRRLHDYLTDLSRGRKTFRLLAPGRRLIYTCDPAVVEHILRANFANYGKGAFNRDNTGDLLGDGIFAVDGDRWRQQRKIASHEFASSAMRDFSGAVFRTNAAKLAAVVAVNAASKQPMEFQGLLQKAAMDTIFAVTFGSDLDTLGAASSGGGGGGGDEGSRFASAVDDASEFTLLRYVNPFWKAMRLLNVGPEAALRERVKAVDAFVYERIRARSEELRAAAAAARQGGLPVARRDMLSRFIEAATTTGGDGAATAGAGTAAAAAAVDHKYLRDIVLSIVIAGKDTSVEALAWFFYMACKHPRVQERVFREAREATGEKASSMDEFARCLTDEALGKMHYLHAALTETLRLYPALPLNNKECFSDDVLPGGFSVGKGDVVFYVPYAMGRMEYLWGSDAEVFRPERWLHDNGEFQQESPFKFTAFQAGPRICLGKEFAYRQMKVLAAVLLRFFVFSLRDEEASVNYRATITLLIEHGLHLMATPR
ncbi:cytochrome P450 704C1 [Sorghum bicolor]|nr:cytochrome P450 704C1 [Sorghum bicolor]|eukprot:XP_021313056.1 cytochrome P450 704C1 [Sorghum bicolor]